VIVLDIEGKADVNNPPTFEFDSDIFIDKLYVNVKTDRENIKIHCTLDGSTPTIDSPTTDKTIELTETTTISARCFRDGKPVSGTAKAKFTKVKPKESVNVEKIVSGILYKYFEGNWELLPDFNSLKQIDGGDISNFSIEPRKSSNEFGFEYSGFIKMPKDGVYTFYTASDDGSQLYIGKKMIVDNNGQHAIIEKEGKIALAEGYHPIRVTFFEKAGGEDLKVYFKGPDIKKQIISDALLFHEELDNR